MSVPMMAMTTNSSTSVKATRNDERFNPGYDEGSAARTKHSDHWPRTTDNCFFMIVPSAKEMAPDKTPLIVPNRRGEVESCTFRVVFSSVEPRREGWESFPPKRSYSRPHPAQQTTNTCKPAAKCRRMTQLNVRPGVRARPAGRRSLNQLGGATIGLVSDEISALFTTPSPFRSPMSSR